MNLLLFDIDSTLIHPNGAGKLALTTALNIVFGTAGPVEQYDMGGKTDPAIITDLMTAAGLSLTEIEANLPQVYAETAKAGQRLFATAGIRPCPGVLELLAALRQEADVLMGLVTGNVRQVAPMKLAAAGIDPAQFPIGAYGSDHADRNLLPGLALAQAMAYTGRNIPPIRIVVIGDTPADIRCARASQSVAVAVATGSYTLQALAQHRPDHLLPSFVNTQAVLQTLLNR